MLPAACPHCARTITYKPHQSGRVILCPGCAGGQFQLPPEAPVPPPLPMAQVSSTPSVFQGADDAGPLVQPRRRS